MERFKKAIFKQREEINDRMTEMFRLLKELTTSKTHEKVLIREEAKFLVSKNVNSISLTREEEERSDKTDDIESSCKIEKGVKNDIEPIAPIMTVNRLVLEWEERIKLHLEKEMKFNQWRSNNFKSKHPTPVKVEGEMDNEGEVTLYLMRRSLEVLRKFHWMILGERFNQFSHVSSPLLSKPWEY
ncbi:hypothetical protein Tco_0400958 [Tanacetum coccineum]